MRKLLMGIIVILVVTNILTVVFMKNDKRLN